MSAKVLGSPSGIAAIWCSEEVLPLERARYQGYMVCSKTRRRLMSLPLRSEAVASSNAQVRVSLATIQNVVEELHRALSSIQAIAYYVEMTLPLSELPSVEYLRKVQNLVDECDESLQRFVQGCRAAGTMETNPDYDLCVESKCGNAQANGSELSEGGYHS
jgi:hypothetical protein